MGIWRLHPRFYNLPNTIIIECKEKSNYFTLHYLVLEKVVIQCK